MRIVTLSVQLCQRQPYFFIIICVLITTLSFSQDKVKLLNKGNKYFQEGDFEKSEYYYKQSLEADTRGV